MKSSIDWREAHRFQGRCHRCQADGKDVVLHDYELFCAHLKEHYGASFLTCEFCGKISAHKSNFISHLSRHTRAAPFRCAVGDCRTTTSTRQNMVTHISRVHHLAVTGIVKQRQRRSKKELAAGGSLKPKKKKRRKALASSAYPFAVPCVTSATAGASKSGGMSQASMSALLSSLASTRPQPISGRKRSKNKGEGSEEPFEWKPSRVSSILPRKPRKRSRAETALAAAEQRSISPVFDESVALFSAASFTPDAVFSTMPQFDVSCSLPPIPVKDLPDINKLVVGSDEEEAGGGGVSAMEGMWHSMDYILAAAGLQECEQRPELLPKDAEMTSDWTHFVGPQLWDAIVDES